MWIAGRFWKRASSDTSTLTWIIWKNFCSLWSFNARTWIFVQTRVFSIYLNSRTTGSDMSVIEAKKWRIWRTNYKTPKKLREYKQWESLPNPNIKSWLFSCPSSKIWSESNPRILWTNKFRSCRIITLDS